MSYILDALRKSDQQRQRGVPPTLLTPQAAAAAPGRRVSMSQVLLAAVLIGAGIVLGALRPWQSEQPAPATAPAAATPLDSSSRPSFPASASVLPQTPSKSEQAMPAPKTAQAEPPARSRAAAKAEKGNDARDSRPAAVAAVPKKTRKPAPEKPDEAAAGDAAQEQKVTTLAELPEAIRQEIPKMSISVHAYSPVPADRLVGINERVLREGEQVAPGLTLERITLDGMIMSYKGYHFRRGVR